MATVLIRSTRDSAQLSLSPVPNKVGYYQADLKCGALSASVEVYDLSPHVHLVGFFEELGEQWWSGWDGEKEFSSLEGHLDLRATRDALGHVALRVTLRDYLQSPEWTASATLEIDAGQWPEIAEDVREAFRS